MADPAPQKLVHTLVLDTGAIIKNEPSVSTLISKADSLITVPAIIAEIKDAVTKSRVETLLMPFLTIRTPSPAAMQFVTDFARRTGDLPVLSKPDLQIIALTYELECERSGGDAKLRRVPGQKGLNFQVEAKAKAEAEAKAAAAAEVKDESKSEVSPPKEQQGTPEASQDEEVWETIPKKANVVAETVKQPTAEAETTTIPATAEVQQGEEAQKEVTEALAQTSINDDTTTQTAPAEPASSVEPTQDATAKEDDSDSDSDGGDWITPSNLKQKQAEDAAPDAADAAPQKKMEVAVLTTDFAMQNVILQINLNLLSTSLMRIKNVRSVVLRCQACFLVCKEMGKQFCPRCGKPSLTRVSCSTTASGEFKLHLKKNFQYNSRGDRFSIPKAVHGSSNGKRFVGGGKGGWGNELILAEDQKEYERAVTSEKRMKERNLMDEDYLPGILTGERNKSGGRIKVGAGRNVNSKKRN
jgi:RNA-binding protein NOB1